MFEINPIKTVLQDVSERTNILRGTFDYDAKKERLEEAKRRIRTTGCMNEPERAQALGKERSALEAVVEND